MFASHFEIQDGCLSLIKLTNIILTVAAETLNPCSDMKLIPLIHIYFISGTGGGASCMLDDTDL